MDFRAAALETHFVHQQVDEVDPASVFGVNILADQRTGNARGVKPFALILDNDQDSATLLACAAYLDRLAWILTIPVNDSVGQGLTQGGLHGVLLFPRATFGFQEILSTIRETASMLLGTNSST